MGKGKQSKVSLQKKKQDRIQRDFHNALCCGNVKNAQRAFKNGADLNYCDSEKKFTPMYYAAKNNQTEAVKLLFELGVKEIDVKNYQSCTSLGIATAHGNKEVVRILAEAGCDVNVPQFYDKKYPPISLTKDLEIVKILAEHGADLNVKDNAGVTPLLSAVKDGCADIVEYLASLGAEVNTYQDTALNAIGTAVLFKQIDIVRILIDHGADVCCRQYPGYHVLHIPVLKEDNAEMLELLAANGADVNAIDYCGSTPAYLAAAKGFLNSLKVLQKYGADFNILVVDPNDEDDFSKSALYTAINHGHMECVKFLIENGAKIESGPEILRSRIPDAVRVNDAVYAAAHGGNMDVMKYLVEEMNAYIDTSDVSGYAMPLSAAASRDNDEMVRYLVSKGASVNVRTPQGSPMIVASYHGHLRMMKLLDSLGADVELTSGNDVSCLSMSYVTQNDKTRDYIMKLISKKKKKMSVSCHMCGASGIDVKLRLCGGCESVRYCSRQCQVDDYKYHKVECKKERVLKASCGKVDGMLHG